MNGQASPEILAQALSRLESREAGLVAWGVTDAVMSASEVDETLLDFIDDQDDYLPLDLLRHELISRRLLLKVPMSDGFRTRMAETVRVLSTIRQTFRNEHWWDGRPLVLDYRFVTRARSRPRFDVPLSDLVDVAESDVQRSVLSVLAPHSVAGFQKRGTEEVLTAAMNGRASGVVITAGTGSGKTYAFYLPALAWIADSVQSDPRSWLRGLMLYPRKELLRDQLQNALRLTRTLDEAETVSRPLSIGAWYGSTPTSVDYVDNSDGWRKVETGGEVSGWICPYLGCPDCKAELIWTKGDVEGKRERLECTNSECRSVLTEAHIRLTRNTIRRSPPDLLFTTTESLNRQMADSSSWKAFGVRTKPAPQFMLLDEIHTYEGLTGAQNAYLLRRYRNSVRGALTTVGLSATLRNASGFTATLTGLRDDQVVNVEPLPEELENIGAEYLVALRHNPGHRTSPLSTTIQTAMSLTRSIDRRTNPVSGGLYGHRLFVFGDRHDTINRLLWDTLDAEGWYGLTGRPRKGKGPQTLAHLRAHYQLRRAESQRESAEERLPVGQWWWHSELIGHLLEEDQQLRVTRTTALDPGVNETADIIVATSTLEVGYDDPGVGAVLQHKSPHDAARFIQRKGRAGRDVLMRPWTVVVLSDFGRDRLTWDTFEQLFEPELPPQHLPIGNRYVHRIQAVYSLMDWLALELSSNSALSGGSIWRDLSQPALSESQDRQQARQEALGDLVDEVLSGGPAFDRLVNYLKRSLSLGSPDLEAVLWSPPRSIMMAVLPTARRRLQSGWRGEVPTSGRFGPDPLPEFVTSSQFGDLLTPEVRVTLPTTHGDVEEDVAPVLSVLTEYLPGNVSRRHSIYSPQDRHWVPPPESFVGPIDIVDAYNAEYVRHVEVRGNNSIERYAMYRPRSFSVEIPPVHVAESTSVRPEWRSMIEPLGNGTHLDLPMSHWASLIRTVRSHLHRSGDGVYVARMAGEAIGSTYARGEYREVRVSFDVPIRDEDSFEGPPSAALGVDFEADGIVLGLQLPEQLPPISPVERTNRLDFLVRHHAAFRGISIFNRKLLSAVVIATSTLNLGARAELWNELEDSSLRVQLAAGLQLLRVDAIWEPSVLDAGDNPEPSRLEAVWQSDDGLAAIREVAHVLWEGRSASWDVWSRRRLAATVGSVFMDALVRLVPDLDIEDLAMDVDPSAELDVGAEVWLTETVPGGNGYLEQVHSEIAADPARMIRLLDGALEPSDVERLDGEMRQLLELVSQRGACYREAEELRQAWSRGHDETVKSHQRLVRRLAQVQPTLSRLAIVTLVNRVLGPGARPELPELCEAAVIYWDSLEERTGLSIDSRIASAVVSRELGLDPAVLHLDSDVSEDRFALALGALMWPRRSAVQLGLTGSDRFGQESSIDRSALASLVQDSTPEISVTQTDLETISRVKEKLLLGQVVVVTNTEDAPVINALNLRLQSEPVEVGSMFAYPSLVGVTRSGVGIRVRFVLHEAMR